MRSIVAVCSLMLSCTASSNELRKFPDDFIFGVTTAAYQIEGAWNEDGKGENIWDHLVHTRPELVKDRSNGDIAADSYHNYKRDVEMVRELGLDMYHFSLSWARLLPDGFINNINAAGVAYYNNLIDELLKYNIKPMVSIFHWELPQRLQELGGFMNPLIADWFEDFARLAFQRYGDRVKHWITLNEPDEFCFGYGGDAFAPMLNLTGIGDYLCAKNVLLAHARAYRAYHKDFKEQGGVVGIAYSVSAMLPYNDTEEDHLAVKLAEQAAWGVHATPIFSASGGFPKEFSEVVAKKSAEQGFPRSRLPTLSDDEIALIRGSSDFFGLNHYSAEYVSSTEHLWLKRPVPSREDDLNVGDFVPEDWPKSASNWLSLRPGTLYQSLKKLQNMYNDPVIYVTESGWSTRGGLEDDDRVKYLRTALESALDALQDGVNVKGYMVWSLMDNFEWLKGYTERFGLYEVDFSSAARARAARRSALVYKQVARARVVDQSYRPADLAIAIDPGH